MCVESPTKDCKFCLLLTPKQKAQVATPSYKPKKEKRDAKKAELSSPSKDGTLVDPSIISVIGAVSDKVSVSSPLESAPEKKLKKDKPSAPKSKKTVEKSTDKKMEELDKKWSDRFNRLEVLLMSKSFPPTFSSAVKVTPTHSPPSTIGKDTEPFFQPTSSERTGQDFSAMHQSASQLRTETTTTSSERTGLGSSALLHQPSSQLRSDLPQPESSPKRTVSDFSAAKHQSTSQLTSDRPRIRHKSALVLTPLLSSISRSSQLSSDRHRPQVSERTGTDSSAPRHQSTSQLASHRPHLHRPSSSVPTDTGSPHLHRQRKDSASSCSSEASSELCD